MREVKATVTRSAYAQLEAEAAKQGVTVPELAGWALTHSAYLHKHLGGSIVRPSARVNTDLPDNEVS